MKCKVVLTRTVGLIVEGKNKEAIMDWLRQTTPEEAYLLVDGAADDSYDEEILYNVNNNVIADYVIKEER